MTEIDKRVLELNEQGFTAQEVADIVKRDRTTVYSIYKKHKVEIKHRLHRGRSNGNTKHNDGVPLKKELQLVIDALKKLRTREQNLQCRNDSIDQSIQRYERMLAS